MMSTTSIKLDLDVGNLVSNAGRARDALAALDEAIKKARAEGRGDDIGKLYYEKDRLQGRTARFERDVKTMANNPKYQGIGANGQPVFKIDEKYVRLIEAQIETEKKLLAAYKEKIEDGKINEAMALTPQIEKQQSEFHKLAGQSNGSENMGTEKAVNSLVFEKIASSINDGLKLWVSSLDRSGIAGAYSSGDLMGGRVAEKQRNADTWGKVTEKIFSIAGAITDIFKIPGVSTILKSTGELINFFAHIPSDEEKKKKASVDLWTDQSKGAMELAALQGNPANVRGAWETAANTAQRFGFSAEEGVELYKQAAMQGLDGSSVQQILQYERATGADRGTLSSIANMSARYGGKDALKEAWAGLQASGMKTGQYSEYLRGMQRIMEEGISKGFIRSSEQVAKNLTTLAAMTNNNPLWEGEHGAHRLTRMNAGIESATGLQSTSDIMAYRTAKEMAGDGSYVKAMMQLEKGFSTEFFRKYMEMTDNAEGGGYEGVIERMRQTFGLNYTEADTLYSGWKLGKSDADLEALYNKTKPLPSSDSPELEWSKMSVETANVQIRAGQVTFDEVLGEFKGVKKPSEEEKTLMEARARYDADEFSSHGKYGDIADRANELFYGKGKNPVGFFSRNDVSDKKIAGEVLGAYVSDTEYAKNLGQVFDIMDTFTAEQRRRVNEDNSINKAMLEGMTDKTGQLLLEEIRKLQITINLP